MRDAFIEELTDIAAEDPNLILITGDLGFGVFDDFSKNFPNQFLNVGVAEQNMTMVAAGMAMEGKKVFTYSIGNFPTLRCLEQIRNDICYHDLNVTIVSIGGGFSYGQLGMSHHATEDLSIMRALPNLLVTAPSSILEVKRLTQELYESSCPSYLRLDKSHAKGPKKASSIQLGKALKIREGKDLTIISCGGILHEAIKAADLLEKEGFDLRILSMHTIKPLDHYSIDEAVKETGGIITLEENNILGGLGSAVAEYCLTSNQIPNFFHRIGIKDEYSSVVGDQNFLRDYYKLGSFEIVRAIKSLLQK